MAHQPFFRKRASGVTRIVRDGYGKKSDWYALTAEVKKRDGHKCIFCGKLENPKAGIYHQVHHIVGIAKGGTTCKANLGTTCKECHEKRPGHSHMRGQADKAKAPVVAFSQFSTSNSVSSSTSKFSTWRK